MAGRGGGWVTAHRAENCDVDSGESLLLFFLSFFLSFFLDLFIYSILKELRILARINPDSIDPRTHPKGS